MSQNADAVPIDDNAIRGPPMGAGGQGLINFLSTFFR